MPNVAVGQLAYAGVQRETTFGVGVTPGYFPGFDSLSPSSKNTKIAIPGGKKRAGQKFAPVGPYDFTASLSATPDLDVLGPLLAWAFGAQTTPTPAIAWQSTLTSAVAIGGTTLSISGLVGTSAPAVGQAIVVGYGTANAETLTLSAIGATLTVGAATKTHAAGDAVAFLSTLAYTSTLSFAPVAYLPSFTLEEYRGYDAIDHLGTTVDSVKLSWQPGGLLKPDFSLVAQSEIKNASPATPSFSVLAPLQSDAAAPPFSNGVTATPLLNGAAFAAGTFVRSVDLSLNNSLNKNFRQIGSRYVQGFPVGQRMASGSIKASFADRSLYEQFLGAAGATGPQSAIGGVALLLSIASTSLADPGKLIPYSLIVNLPALFPTGDPVPLKNYGDLEQTFSFDAAASSSASNDDMSLTITTTASTAY